MKIIEKNMKKQQKTDYFKTLQNPHFYWENPHFRVPLFVKTNPISQIQETLQALAVEALTAIYSPNYDKKNKPKTNPNKPNFKTQNRRFSEALAKENKPNFSKGV